MQDRASELGFALAVVLMHVDFVAILWPVCLRALTEKLKLADRGSTRFVITPDLSRKC